MPPWGAELIDVLYVFALAIWLRLIIYHDQFFMDFQNLVKIIEKQNE